jgi:hypothetical protein
MEEKESNSQIISVNSALAYFGISTSLISKALCANIELQV